jgi:hypothetical protein
MASGSPQNLNGLASGGISSSNATWRDRQYASKQLEAYAVEEAGDWLVITVLVKLFGPIGGKPCS